jgi:hypothetical protein
LECLPKGGCRQPRVQGIDERIKRKWSLQLPEYISAVEHVIQIINLCQIVRVTRICGYIRAHVPVHLLYSTRHAQPKKAHDTELLTGYKAAISNAAILTVA